MRNNHSHFRNFGSGTTFICRVCRRKTRQVRQAIGSELCPECEEIAMIDNMVNDSGYSEDSQGYKDALAECERLLAKAVKQGSDASRIKACNDFIWRS